MTASPDPESGGEDLSFGSFLPVVIATALEERFVYGTPDFAPLVSPNPALLGARGPRDLAVKRRSGVQA